MSKTPQHATSSASASASAPPIGQLPPLRQRLAALEAALRNALLLGDNLPPHIVADLASQAAGLTAHGVRLPPAEARACKDCLARIEQVHDQLTCRLRQQQQETAAQLARMRQGKRGLKAYRAM
jgi:uncharacterized membrane protein